MGDIANKLQEAGVSNDMAGAVAVGENIYSKVNWVYGAYSAAKDILTSLGYLSAPKDPLEEIAKILATINKKLDDIFSKVAEIQELVTSGSQLTTLQTITTETKAPAHTAFIHALAHLHDPKNEEIKGVFISSLDGSWGALQSLSDDNDTLWLRLYTKEALYNDDWSGWLDPGEVAHGGLNYAWDYRTPLPEYLQELGWHSVAFIATDAGYQSGLLSEIQQLVKFLKEKVYDRILNSFYFIRPPAIYEMQYVIPFIKNSAFETYEVMHLEKMGSFSFKPAPYYKSPYTNGTNFLVDYLYNEKIPGGRWILSNYVYGTVEKYSGYSSTHTYPVHELALGNLFLKSQPFEVFFPGPTSGGSPNWWEVYLDKWWENWKKNLLVDRPSFQKVYDMFIVRHRVRTWREARKTYRNTGLYNLRMVIGHFNRMFKMEQNERLEYTMLWSKDENDKMINIGEIDMSAWASLREVSDMIPASLKAEVESPFSFRSASKLLTGKSSSSPVVVSMRNIFLLDETLN